MEVKRETSSVAGSNVGSSNRHSSQVDSKVPSPPAKQKDRIYDQANGDFRCDADEYPVLNAPHGDLRPQSPRGEQCTQFNFGFQFC
jgi:hypothetical protein